MSRKLTALTAAALAVLATGATLFAGSGDAGAACFECFEVRAPGDSTHFCQKVSSGGYGSCKALLDGSGCVVKNPCSDRPGTGDGSGDNSSCSYNDYFFGNCTPFNY